MDAPDTLKKCINLKLNQYFKNINSKEQGNLYQICIAEVEKPLLEATLTYVNNNQSQAAKVLGINRSTLKKKLNFYQLN